MAPQQIFDKVVAHAKTMKRKSGGVLDVDGDETCAYRNPLSAERCFVGALIPNRHYRKAMEGNDVYSICSLFKLPNYIHENTRLLADLQGIHDAVARGSWPKRFRELARDWDLDASSVDGLGTRWVK